MFKDIEKTGLSSNDTIDFTELEKEKDKFDNQQVNDNRTYIGFSLSAILAAFIITIILGLRH